MRGREAVNPSQRLSARFADSHVSVAAGRLKVAIAPRAVGYGGALRRLGAVPPKVAANRVVYRRDGVREWWVNGPLGLEQAFEVSERPGPAPGAVTSPLRVSMTVTTNAAARLEGDALVLSGEGASLRYGGLLATDADGTVLTSWMVLRAGQLSLMVDDARARYPIRIDPLVQQGSKLTATGESGGAFFGASVAVSGDGSTALIGGPGNNNRAGAAWVFVRTGAVWTQSARLMPQDPSGATSFGQHVALSSDGNVALIGGPEDNMGVGAAWIFTRAGSSWTQQGNKLTGNGETGVGLFGNSVALSADGSTAIVGASSDSNVAGAAFVFARSGSTWAQQGNKLVGSNIVGSANFGYSVALSADGSTAMIGGLLDDSNVGAAWPFTRSGSIWSQQGPKLTAVDENGGGFFGQSVALSADGGTALIGAGEDNGGVGAAWMYFRTGSTWNQLSSKLKAGDETGAGNFGAAVALSADANTAVIAGPADNQNTGAYWMVERLGSTYNLQGGKVVGSGEIPSGGFGPAFGQSIALSTDGGTLVVGGPSDNNNIGAAWVFSTPADGGSGAGSGGSTGGTAAEQRPPAVVTGRVRAVNVTAATLTGSVDPNGAATDVAFAYGTTTRYGHVTPSRPVGAGLGEVAVSAAVRRLRPATSYHYRLMAVNASGSTQGTDHTFTTKRSALVRIAAHGGLLRPAGVSPRTRWCRGSVTITLRRGKRVLGRHRTRLHLRDGRCEWRSAFTLSRKRIGSAKRLTQTSRFNGNSLLAPSTGETSVAVPR